LLRGGKLALRLLRDERVPFWAKLVPAAAILYVLSPLDVVPDWIPVLGQLDDAAMIAAGISLFIRLCPPELVDEHERGLGKRGTIVEGQAWSPDDRPPS
jgi:uncharacterized membrane protein YkvA (DUF1232 family)